MPILLMDTGLAAVFLGLVSLVKPLAFLGLGTRRLAVAVIGAGGANLRSGAPCDGQQKRQAPGYRATYSETSGVGCW